MILYIYFCSNFSPTANNSKAYQQRNWINLYWKEMKNFRLCIGVWKLPVAGVKYTHLSMAKLNGKKERSFMNKKKYKQN